MISTAVRLARVGSTSELGAAALLFLGFPVMLLAALLPNLWLFTAAAAATYAGDWWLHRQGSRMVALLRRVRAGLSIRFLARELLLVLLLSRMGFSGTAAFYLGVSGFLVFYGLQAPHAALLTLIRNSRRLPVVTRNIDMSGLRIPGAPPRLLTRRAAEKMLHLDLAMVAGLIITAATERTLFGLVGAVITVALGTAFTVALLPYLRSSRKPARTERVLEYMDEWLRGYRPTVALYFSGSRTSAYQANMWLETLAALDERPLVILRERYIVPKLAPTSVPVLCVPSAVHLMGMDLTSLRVALYPANVGKNIHMLREPGMKHVFIGHGDSDKIASVNPYSKAYDEVWTAGRAGRDRYALADVGVRDDDIVEVGRPQLGAIVAGTGEPVGPMPTVLYAPTWEGWTDDPGNTSLILAGENVVKQLVAARPEVRVLYKPHPFTGSRCPKAKAAHERILSVIEQANAERSAEPQWRERAAADAAERDTAAAEVRRIAARLAELETAVKEDADEAEGSRDGVMDPAHAAEAERLRAQWNDAYWKSFGWWEHRVITGSRPHLYDCFNRGDMMVSDISSVVSDFIASEKPYAITDTTGLGAEEFKRQNSTARAAFILTPDASGVPELLESVRGSASDPLAHDRRTLKEYLLGPDEPTSLVRFGQAIKELSAKAEARLGRLERAGIHDSDLVEIPQPREEPEAVEVREDADAAESVTSAG
ncbi:CDP-glycerol glycerophosphotransferase family protein [Wenjunlia tyrosinilytica]|uniref:Integral membrane protein n=1 Tax=Wenjunlia tyrosinilytica TaxID=1544741 RepID=A0A918DSS5_9ACTN|nr:CDP-glycerol glycerophosphotransferase family protein [Wenjunlia tyrosinilytica]GGO80865.1 hypothetical protein GCM10012280_03780 [Wenjunlia tyrosinilytica]